MHATTRGDARAAAASGGAGSIARGTSSTSPTPARSTRWSPRVRPDFVFHLAGLVKGARDRALVLPALEANLTATVRLLDAAAAHGCRRFVQVGSLEEPPIDQPATAPASPYAAAKTAATAYSRMYAELYAVPVAIARVFMVYGPGPQDDQKLVPYVTRALLAGIDAQPLERSARGGLDLRRGRGRRAAADRRRRWRRRSRDRSRHRRARHRGRRRAPALSTGRTGRRPAVRLARWTARSSRCGGPTSPPPRRSSAGGRAWGSTRGCSARSSGSGASEGRASCAKNRSGQRLRSFAVYHPLPWESRAAARDC